jgi:hypothetical protein
MMASFEIVQFSPPVQRGGRALEHRSKTACRFPLSGVV